MRRWSSTSAHGRLALVVLCAGTTQGLGQVGDCDADGVPDIQQTLTWVAPTPFASFTSPMSWQGVVAGQSPDDDILCRFDPSQSMVDPAGSVLFGFGATVRGLEVVSGDASIELTGFTSLVVTGDLPGCRETAVATAPGSAGSLSLVGSGLVSLARLTAGVADGSRGDVVLSDLGGGAFDAELGATTVAAGGDGSLLLDGARAAALGSVVVGEQPGTSGVLTVAGAGSQLTFVSSGIEPVIVGAGGRGDLNALGGGVIVTDAAPPQLVLGDFPGAEGNVTLAGGQTQATLGLTSFDIGFGGEGNVLIRDGASLTTFTNAPVRLAAQPGSTANVQIRDGEWTEALSPVRVGVLSNGAITLGDAGRLQAETRVLRRGILGGGGVVFGSVELIGGRLAPGRGADMSRELLVNGRVDFFGNRTPTGPFERGRMTVRLDGFGPGGFDRLRSPESVSLAGSLTVFADESLDPQIGQSATIIHALPPIVGTFDGLTLPSFSNGTRLDVRYTPGTVAVEVVERKGNDPQFEEPQGFESVGPLPQTAAVTGDVTGDGLPDLVVVASNPNGPEGVLAVLENLGNDTNGAWLGYAPPRTFSTVESEPEGVAIADFNDDQLNDVVFVTRGTGGNGIVRVRANNPADPGDLANAFGPPLMVNADPVDLAVGDFDGDGRPDPVVAGTFDSPRPGPDSAPRMSTTGRVITLDLPSATADEIDVGVQPGSVDTYGSDIGGGTSDIAVTCVGESMVFALQNDGMGDFPTIEAQAVGANPTGLDTADIDGDGLADLLTTDTDSGTVSILRSMPGAPPISFEPAVSFATDDAAGSEPASGVFTDLDGDGDLDVAVIARDDGGVPRVRRLLFEGLGPMNELVFLAVEDAAPPAAGESIPIELLTDDVDADGLEDLIVIYADAAGTLRADRMVPLPLADVSVRLNATPVCPADLALPCGILDLADVDAFITAFLAGEAEADLAPPFGLLDLADIDAFITSFLNGCP